MKTEESRLEKEVEVFMNKRKVWQLGRYQAQSSQFGLPDRLYLYKGILLGLELKTMKGTPSDLQLRKIKSINENGGVGIIVRSVDDVETILHCIDAKRTMVPTISEDVLRLYGDIKYDD